MSFPAVPLGELFKVASGNPAPQDPEAFAPEGDPFVRAGSLTKLLAGAAEESLERLTPESARMHRLRLFPRDTILFAKSGMSALKGHIYRLEAPAYVVSHLAALIPTPRVDARYARWALEVFSPTRLVKDSAYPSIRLPEIEEMKIALPPPNEQRRIAAILDQADALRRSQREALRKAEALQLSQFETMFGDPRQNLMGWSTVPFGDLLTDIESGWSPTCLDRPAGEDEWGVLKLGAVTYGRFDDTAQKALPEGTPPRPRIEVHVGDLLFTRKNTHELVAACALVRETRPRLLLPDLIFRLCLADPLRSHPEYIHALLSHPAKRAEIQNLASGAAGSMPNISKARLRTVPISLPPPELQARFAEFVEELESLRSRAVDHLGYLDNLFASLQHRAFRGEL